MSTVPSIAEVIERLKRRERVQVGRGHAFTIYGWDDVTNQLYCELWDSGRERREPCSESVLADAIALNPHAFAVPTLAEVIERMKQGEQIQCGGGRSFVIYGWDPETNQLYQDQIDEGYDKRYPCSEAHLASEIAEHPQVFRRVV